MKLVLFDTWIVENIVYLNFRISALLSLHNLFKFLYQCIVINEIAMAHLVLFCFTLNLTDACPDYLSVRSRAVQKPVNWFVVQIIWQVPVWCRVLPAGVSEHILVNFLSISFFTIDSVLMLQDYRRAPMCLFYLPMMPMCFMARKISYF